MRIFMLSIIRIVGRTKKSPWRISKIARGVRRTTVSWQLEGWSGDEQTLGTETSGNDTIATRRSVTSFHISRCGRFALDGTLKGIESVHC